MAPQTAISKAVCYKTKNEQLWEKAVHFLLVATNWFYASLPTVFCTITRNLGYQVHFSMESAPGPVAGVYGIAKLTIFAKSAVLWHSLLLWI